MQASILVLLTLHPCQPKRPASEKVQFDQGLVLCNAFVVEGGRVQPHWKCADWNGVCTQEAFCQWMFLWLFWGFGLQITLSSSNKGFLYYFII